MTQAQRYAKLIDLTEWDADSWRAARDVKSEVAYQALRTAVIETAKQGLGGMDALTAVIWHLAYSQETEAELQEIING